jgi:hypothetical protein
MFLLIFGNYTILGTTHFGNYTFLGTTHFWELHIFGNYTFLGTTHFWELHIFGNYTFWELHARLGATIWCWSPTCWLDKLSKKLLKISNRFLLYVCMHTETCYVLKHMFLKMSTKLVSVQKNSQTCIAFNRQVHLLEHFRGGIVRFPVTINRWIGSKNKSAQDFISKNLNQKKNTSAGFFDSRRNFFFFFFCVSTNFFPLWRISTWKTPVFIITDFSCRIQQLVILIHD